MGGDNEEIAYIQQSVSIPPIAPVLHYWHWIDSTDDCGYDFAWILVDFTTVVGRYGLCSPSTTLGWALHSVDMSTWAGQTLPLQIRVETDDLNESSLLVDNLFFSFESTGTSIFRDGFESETTFRWQTVD